MAEPLVPLNGIAGGVEKTGVISITVPVHVDTLIEAVTFIPSNIGINLPLVSRAFRQDETGRYEVHLLYEGLAEESKTQQEEANTFELDVSMAESPIQEHPNFTKLKEKFGWDPAEKTFPEQLPQGTGGEKALSKGGSKDTANPLHGVQNFLDASATFRITYAARHVPGHVLEGIGTVVNRPPFIGSFQLPEAVKKRNWLKLAPKIVKRGNAIQITEEYLLSGRRKFSKEIYGAGQFDEV